jgi:hypothetical protein
MSFIAAAVVGGTALVGGIVSSSASSKAANKAAQVSQDTTAQNNALARDIYAQNTQTLAPFVQQGGAATSYINQLLGIQTPQPVTQPPPGTMSGTSTGGFVGSTIGRVAGAAPAGTVGRTGEDFAWNGYGRDPNVGYVDASYNIGRTMATPSTGQTGGAPALAPGSAASAFDTYRNGTGYQFRLGEGLRAVTANKALSGLLNSGSAVKSAMRFGDGLAAAEFDNYYNRLAGQQGVGLSAASAQAGVANNYSSQVQGNNSTNATNVGNAAIAKGNAVSNAVNGITNSLAYVYGNRG